MLRLSVLAVPLPYVVHMQPSCLPLLIVDSANSLASHHTALSVHPALSISPLLIFSIASWSLSVLLFGYIKSVSGFNINAVWLLHTSAAHLGLQWCHAVLQWCCAV